MNITRETYEKIEGLRLVGLRDVLINANRIDFECDGPSSPTYDYDLGVKNGVHLMTDRILEEFGFERQEIQVFYEYARALESEDPPVVIE